MGIHRGPNTVKDGLVFGYDTGYGVADNTTATRFYPGENTVNYTTDTASQGGWGGSCNVVDSSRKKFRLNVSNFNGNPGAGWRAFTWDLRAHTGQSVTISATVEVPASSPGTFAWIMMGQTNTHTSNGTGAGMYMGYSASGERVQKTTTTKERITWSGTLGNSGTASQPSGHVGFTVWYNNGVPGTNSYVEVSDVQIELRSHETPFVNGTRSSTASLIDLKKTTDIDVSNVSFDATGQPDFDGTDDRIVSSTGINLNSYTSLTYEGVVKAVGLASHDRWFSGTTGSTFHNPDLAIGTDGQLRYIFSNSGIGSWITPSGLTIDTTKFNHLVYTFTNAGVVKIYVNGTQEHTATYSSATFPSNSKFMTGMRFDNNAEGVDGSIPIAKVYSKALSAAEVKQNYNVYKNRFDI